MRLRLTLGLLALLGGLHGPAHADINLEGQSGGLLTPDAEIITEGEVEFQLGRYLSRVLPNRPDTIVRTYSLTIGYLPRTEVTARFTDYPDAPDVTNNLPNFQDRSAALKYQLHSDENWSFAVGGTDIGGESRKQQTAYGVVSYKTDDVTVSAGAGTDQLEGVFGSVRWRAGERVALVAEHDTDSFNYGLELKPLKGVTLKGAVVNDDTALAASYSFPLDSRGRETPCCPVVVPRCETTFADPCAQAEAVRDVLTAESFENVLVGASGSTLFVEFENRRFREQLDAIGVVALLAAMHAGPEVERLVISPKLQDVPQLSMQVPLADLLRFLEDPADCADCFLVSSYTTGGYPPDTQFASEGSIKNGRGEVLLRPTTSLVVAQGTLPVWRTSAGIGAAENVFLGRGLTLQARQDWPLFNDIEEKTVPFSRDTYVTYLDRWADDLHVTGSAGYYGRGDYGFNWHAGYYMRGERFRLGARYAYLQNNETSDERGVGLGEVSWFEPSLDWEVTALGGWFLDGDQGLRFESRRYFGPTELTFFAYDTDLSSPQGGFRVFVPLATYNQGRHGAWRVNSTPNFGYSYRTDSTPSGDIGPGPDLTTARQRLNPAYVQQNLHYLRRAAHLFLSQ